MGLFASKVEKALAKIKKKEIKIDVRYSDGNQAHPCKIMRVDRDKFLMTGFAETLREDTMSVSVKELAICFNTRVTHKTHDIRGQLLYYCTIPDKLDPFRKHVERYFVYPKAVAAIAESSLEDLIVEHEDVKMKKMYLWDITDTGMDLVNVKGYAFEKGTKFETCKIQVGKVEAMAALEVMGETTKTYGKEKLPILQVKFAGALENKEELFKLCRRIDSM